MNILPSLDEFKLADGFKPHIGFRVVVSGGNKFYQNTLYARDPQSDATSSTLQDHLCWKRTPSPFVSLWRSWSRAVEWAESRKRLGAEDIDIVAVWIYDRVVYDAHKAAMVLPLLRNKLHCCKNEVVTIGFGSHDNHNILARFSWVTERKWETVIFFLERMPTSADLPVGLLDFEFGTERDDFEREQTRRWKEDPFAALRAEVYSRTGRDDKPKVYKLARLLYEKIPPWLSLVEKKQDIAAEMVMARLAGLHN